jgi:hypothetical protein
MKKGDVKAVLGRVLTWPEPAQAEAVASLRAIEDEWVGALFASKLALTCNALVRFGDALDTIFELTSRSGSCLVTMWLPRAAMRLITLIARVARWSTRNLCSAIKRSQVLRVRFAFSRGRDDGATRPAKRGD